MNVCHTWQRVKSGMGNVPVMDWTGIDPVTQQPTGWTVAPSKPSDVWDGPNMPPGAEKECTGNDMFTGLPLPC
jgi:hypothetical protein